MNGKAIIAALLLAGPIAATVKLYISPTVENAEKHDVQDTTPSLNSAEVQPDALNTETRRNAVLYLKNDGHYWARSLVNKKATVDVMVDTGASIVALTYSDAEKLGLKPDTLDYRWRVSTAGGETMGASVLLDSIKISQVHIRDVEAMVLRSDLEQSLLGMSFLSKLHSYEFRGERLILRQ